MKTTFATALKTPQSSEKMIQAPPVVLALDLSLACTGWAVSDLDGITSGVKRFPTRKGFSPAIRFADFNQWLDSILSEHLPDLVLFEIPVCRAQGQVQDALIGVKTRLDEACAVRKIPLRGLYPTSIKKHFASDGNAAKFEMQGWAHYYFPSYDYFDDDGADQADSLALCWIWRYKPEVFEPKAKKPKKRRV